MKYAFVFFNVLITAGFSGLTADIDGDGVVNLADLAILSEQWLCVEDPNVTTNRVTNGTFDTDTAWTKSSDSVTISGGTADFATGDNETLTLSQTIEDPNLVPGWQYTFSYEVAGSTLADEEFSVLLGGAEQVIAKTVGTHTYTLTCGAADSKIVFKLDSSFSIRSIQIDNVSLIAAEPIAEQILQNVLQTAEEVTDEGYQVEIVPARPKSLAWEDRYPDDQRALVWKADSRDADEPACGVEDLWLTAAIAVLSRTDRDDASPADTRCERIAAAIEKAMKADRTRGGLAADTITLPPDRERSEDWPGIVLRYEIHYYTTMDDPYSLP